MNEHIITATVYIRGTLAAVWDALTNPDVTELYWAQTRIESDWQPGSRIVYRRLGEVTDEHTLLEIEPRRRLLHTFHPVLGEFRDEAPSRVTLQLDASGEVVRLRLRHDGFPSGSKVLPACRVGWPMILHSLKSLIETGRALPAFEFDDLHIRRAVPSDAPALAELAARTFADAFGADNTPEDLQAHLASSYGPDQQALEIADPSVVTLLAERNGALIAYAQVRDCVPPACVVQEHAIEIQRFYVDRSAHGSGAAQRLMAAARQAASELGGRHVWLGVWEHNQRALAFYRKAGFVTVGSKIFQVGADPQTDRVLVAALDAGQPL